MRQDILAAGYALPECAETIEAEGCSATDLILN